MPIEEIFQQGYLFCQHKRFLEAIECFQKVLEKDAKHVPTYYYLGALFFREGFWQKSLQCYQTLLELQPDLAAAHYMLGDLLGEIGEMEQAEFHLTRYYELSHSDMALICLATLLPPIYQSEKELDAWRERFKHKVEQLSQSSLTLQDPLLE